MNSKIFALFLVVFPVFVSCNKKQEVPSQTQGKVNFQDGTKNGPSEIPAADTSTFFPLLKDSYWVYSDIQEGEIKDSNFIKDSVVSVKQNDSETVVEVKDVWGTALENSDLYKIDKNG